MVLGTKMPGLHIGDLKAEMPIIQGGMGVGISLSNLAARVADQGGIGVISATGIGMLEPDFNKSFGEANKRALRGEIARARQMTRGIIGVNIMVALSDYHDLLQVAVEENVDVVFIGAGLPLRFPEALLSGSTLNFKTKIVPIVSSAKAAKLIFQYWHKHFNRVPDGVVVEGPLAGGHLGFKKEHINHPDYRLEKLVPQVIAAIEPYRQYADTAIPVIAAGGIFSGADIHRFIRLGAQGVQMATRFVATHECDASIEFKQAYVDCKEEEIMIIDSPVGLPGRVIKNRFIEEMSQGKKVPYKCSWRCLKNCDFRNSPYCICAALTNAKMGILEDGFAFAGANAHRVNEIISVEQLFSDLSREYEQAVLAEAYS